MNQKFKIKFEIFKVYLSPIKMEDGARPGVERGGLAPMEAQSWS